MDLINKEMIEAINNLTISESERKLLIDILYAERVKKNLEWDNDAITYIKKEIDSYSLEDSE